MSRFDVSARAAELGVPLAVLERLQRELGDYMLIGALARDLHVAGLAGLPLGRATQDLDISIAVGSLSSYESRIERLPRTGGLATRFSINDYPVDILPFGGVEKNGIVEPQRDISLDVTGMADAYARPDWFDVGLIRPIRVASLAGMVALKIVAWHYRRHHTKKDADDLGVLFDATHAGHYEERCWTDSAAVELDYDVYLVGPFLTGRQIGREFGAGSIGRIREILDDSLELLSHETPAGAVPRRDQIVALRKGLEHE